MIAGVAKRIPLIAPPGFDTRPTSDMAKEGLFNILADRLPDAGFLDLYAGSGAVGIEALSRGAKHAVFVEKSRTAIETLKTNLARTRLVSKAELFLSDSIEAVRKLGDSKTTFDIIFLDPPYSDGLLLPTLENLSKSSILAEGGLIIAESESKQIDNIPSSLYLTDTRKYGRAFFIFLKQVVC